MSNNLFSDAAKAQLTALKKQLESTPSHSPTGDTKPDTPINLPSKKSIEKQIAAQKKKQAQSPAPVVEKNQDTLEDELLFKHAMQGVVPLADKNTVSPSELKKKQQANQEQLAKRAAAEGEKEVPSDLPISDMQAMLNPVAAEAYLMYKQTTVQQRVFNQLKEGNLRWFEAVDIHGSTIEEARIAVIKVIQMAQENDHTVLKIVHGKGNSQDKQAVLKTCVNGWLRQHPDVLAFCSAVAKDGGTGAVIVLIKRQSDANVKADKRKSK